MPLNEQGWQISLRKVQESSKAVKFLWHCVIDKILQQLVLVNVMDLQVFWGLMGCWPTFIHRLANISCSLHNLIKSIVWD